MTSVERTFCLTIILVLLLFLLGKAGLLEREEERLHRRPSLETLFKDPDKVSRSKCADQVRPELRNVDKTSGVSDRTDDSSVNHIDLVSNNKRLLRSEDIHSKSETTKREEAESVDGESIPFWDNLYRKLLAHMLFSEAVLRVFFAGSNAMIEDYIEKNILDKIEQFFKDLWDKIVRGLKYGWDKFIEFLDTFTVEVFMVVFIIVCWSCCFHIHVCRKVKRKKKEKKKEKALVIANLAAMEDLENAQEEGLSGEENGESMLSSIEEEDSSYDEDETLSMQETEENATVTLSNGSAR